MWVTKLLIPLVKKNGFLAKKWPNLAQNWHCCPLLAHLVPWFLVWTSPIVGTLGIKTLAEIRWLCIDHRSSRTMWYEVLKAPCILNPDWWPRSWLSNAGTSILEPYLHHLQRPNTVLDRLEQFSCLYALLEVKKSERRGQGYHMGRARILGGGFKVAKICPNHAVWCLVVVNDHNGNRSCKQKMTPLSLLRSTRVGQ